MDLILLVLGLAAVGFLVWLLTTKVPMDPVFRYLIYAVVVLAVVLWLLRRFGGTIPNFF